VAVIAKKAMIVAMHAVSRVCNPLRRKYIFLFIRVLILLVIAANKVQALVAAVS
jgi:hypothetical protein